MNLSIYKNLYNAIKDDKLNIVTEIIRQDDININKCINGRCALLWSIYYNRVMIAEAILQHPKIYVNKKYDGCPI
jgi:ABC-type Na+ transport system ATPase subunit NatA